MKLIKNTLEYLYYKYYWFQVRVGNRDVAKYMSIVIITFILNFYFINFLILFDFLFQIKIPKIPKVIYISGILVVLLVLYFSLIYNNKYEKIINNKENKEKNNWLAILFPVIGFVVLFLSLFIKMLQNQGKL
ncbi:MAG: hypothetical protein BGO86_01315 [Chryseobacterium sp. 36-9]|nr:MAG: hypothetical protein BGO86_01315 [Chryseobacterium sp. 36-9]